MGAVVEAGRGNGSPALWVSLVTLSVALVMGVMVLNKRRHMGSYTIPPLPTEWVTDNSGVLSTKTLSDMRALLEGYKNDTGHKVVVWINPNTSGEVPDAYCQTLFNAWGIGRLNVDDGVVLFMFTENKTGRIHVGLGLEAAIPDAEAARIGREVIKPFQDGGNYDDAVRDGVAAIVLAITAWEQP